MSFVRLTDLNVQKDIREGDSVRCYDLKVDDDTTINGNTTINGSTTINGDLTVNGSHISLPNSKSCYLQLGTNISNFVASAAKYITGYVISNEGNYNYLSSPNEINYSTGYITLEPNKLFNINFNAQIYADNANVVELVFYDNTNSFNLSKAKTSTPSASYFSLNLNINFLTPSDQREYIFYLIFISTPGVNTVLTSHPYTSLSITPLN